MKLKVAFFFGVSAEKKHFKRDTMEEIGSVIGVVETHIGYERV